MLAKTFKCLPEIICRYLTFMKLQNIHPRNFCVKIFVEPLYISWDYQTLFLYEREAY